MSGGGPNLAAMAQGAAVSQPSRPSPQDAEEERKRRRSTRYYTPMNSDVDQDNLEVYYCLHCGTYALILGTPLHRLPRRKTDGAYVVDATQHTSKQSLQLGQMKLIKREQGAERQYRLHCSGCELFIAYQPVEFSKESRFLYIVPLSLTDNPNLFVRQVSKSDTVPGSIREGDTDTSCRVLVEVSPDAKKTAMTHVSDERVGVLVAESAKDNRLNEELLDYLAMVLGLERSEVKIETGSKSRSKVVLITGIAGTEAYDRLLAAIP